MRAKKNEPLSSLGANTVRVTEKGGPVTTATPSTPSTEVVKTATPETSIDEINPLSKRQQTEDKQKKKVNSRSFSVLDDAWITLLRA